MPAGAALGAGIAVAVVLSRELCELVKAGGSSSAKTVMVCPGAAMSSIEGSSADVHEATNPARSVASATSVTPFVLTISQSCGLGMHWASVIPHNGMTRWVRGR